MKHQELCECGCGKPTSLATKTNKKRGAVKGQPVQFIVGHAARKQEIPISFVVDKKTECWLWQGSKISTGYGNLRVNNKNVLAHRYIYELVNGKIPEGLELDHLCKTHLCINPNHLEPVTHAENCRRGIRAKLSKTKVKRIRAMRDLGISITCIAEQFNVDRHTIRSAINGESWS